MNARLYYRVTDYEMDALHIPAVPYFFHFANASANGLLVNSSSCFFMYLLISFLDTRAFCVFFLRFWKASSFSLWPQTHLNVCPSPSPYSFSFFLQLGQRAFVFL